MDAQSNTSPHLTGGVSSPLEALVMRALRRFGEMSPSTTDGEALSVFLDYANEIIDDIRQHPYADAGLVLPYYVHTTEARAIPDHIMVAGLLFRHALQQKSKYVTRYEGDYYAKLNQLMTLEKFGVGAEFQLQVIPR